MAGPLTIGIDVGGTKIAGGVVDSSGGIREERSVSTRAEDPAAIVDGIAQVFDALSRPGVAAVGVGAAALVDPARGRILTAPNLAWRDLDLAVILRDRFGLPVAVDNDANVAALGEALYGAGRDAADQVMVTVGTGIGGGIVLGGRIYHGAFGIAAEVGHMIVAVDGPLCACGARGCLEALASGRAIGRMARERIADAPDILRRAGGDPERITGELVGEAALEGDPLAREVVAVAGRALGVGLANLVNLLDPEVIIVGGGAAAGLGDLLLAPAREAMPGFVIGAGRRRDARVVTAALGPNAGVVGAAALARSAEDA